MEKYDRAGKDADDNAIRRMRFAFWISKARNINQGYATLTVFAKTK